MLFGMLAVPRPGVRPTVDTPREREPAWEIVRGYGASTTAHMTTWSGHTIPLNGGRDAYVAYRLIGGVALVLGDPIGTPDGCSRAIDALVDLATRNGWTPCYHGATSGYLAEYGSHGLAAPWVADDALIDLATLAFRGKRWQGARSSLNRAKREGITVRMIDQTATFRPRWEPLYLVYPGPASLPRIGYALPRTYLPSLSLEAIRHGSAGETSTFPEDAGAPAASPSPEPVLAGQAQEPERP